MSRSRRETEVKLRFDSAADALRTLQGIGVERIDERHFEQNELYDRDGDSLARSGRLLRLRRVGDRAWLTFKAKISGEHRHKVRRELELAIPDPDSMAMILEGLGYQVRYRYEKYRTLFRRGDLQICLDETPVGCYVELEGAAEEIDRTSSELGFGPDDYVVETYRDLHRRACGGSDAELGDLVFVDSERDGP